MGYYVDKPTHKIGEKCIFCSVGRDKGGVFIERRGPFGNFLGCSRFPDCKGTTPLERERVSRKKRRRMKRDADISIRVLGEYKRTLDERLSHLMEI